MIGRKNFIIAKEILNKYKISIISLNIGYNQGGHILMLSDSDKIMLKHIKESE
ncbi:MAG: hypothetical protein WC667_03740 [Sulfurimonas sp.]|jgi:chemotaxis receptor (MCP) glutamine deamidase CheD